jgi:hypothetical protein
LAEAGATVIDVGINRGRAAEEGKTAPRRRRRFRIGLGGRLRDHSGAGRRRPDDDRRAAPQHPRRRHARAGLPPPSGL